MKCKCGNEIDIKVGSKAVVKGCKILTAATLIVTAKCDKCNEIFQVPVRTSSAIIKE